MRMREFIRQNRKAIDQCIDNAIGKTIMRSDLERKCWVLNDEELYRWAQSEGVPV